MRIIKKIKTALLVIFMALMLTPILSFANIVAVVTPIFEKAQKNNNWKIAFLTGKKAQVVFMNITPKTNPKNEIGMETHKFDQIIIVVEGNGKAILNNKTSMINPGDMIFIPQGTPHNIINLNEKIPLKIISIYSDTDIPAHAVYKKKSDEPHE